MIASDVKGSQAYTDGSRPASLYQVGSYGSALSALQSKMIVAMEGNFISKGVRQEWEVSNFSSLAHMLTNKRLNDSGSPLPIETFLRIHTCTLAIPKRDQSMR